MMEIHICDLVKSRVEKFKKLFYEHIKPLSLVSLYGSNKILQFACLMSFTLIQVWFAEYYRA